MAVRSLQARLFWVAMVALAAFLTLTGVALDQAFTQSAIAAMRERLQSYVWAYLSGSDVSVAGTLILPEFPPDPRFDRPQSGLYGAVFGNKINWQSGSAVGLTLPWSPPLKPNEQRFFGPIQSPVGPLYVLSQGVSWEVPKLGAIELTFNVAESTQGLQEQVDVYRRTLAIWLGATGVVLLLLLVIVLRWSLAPLRKVTTDLARVERGSQDHLASTYPTELSGLTTSLNSFIDAERDRLKRYRNTLSDLAHSLKTPLAVMRSQLESGEEGENLRWTVLEQVGRMDEIVAYQLSRAATSGHQTFAAPLPIEPYAEEIVRSLEKVYANKGVLCEFEIAPAARFHGDQGDLLELLGNLVENGFKWAKRRVLLSANVIPGGSGRRTGLELVVEDDGSGIDEGNVEHLLQRGVRGDERVQGHGIGLAIVQDILRAYQGELSVTRSDTLGGARFAIVFEPR